MTAILDLNDVMLGCWHEGQWTHSPAYAWFDGSRYHYGLPAMRTARRTPRSVNTRYWWQLSTDPLTPALGPARHTADLVHGHLQALHQAAGSPDKLVIAASGSMSRAQLSLLLGIAGTLPFSIEALVHRSALFAAALGTPGAVHVELQMHQALITPVEQRDGTSHAGESQVLPGRGLLALHDRLASAIAGFFVDQTRFDPQRKADSEQALFDALGRVLQDLEARGETTLTIEGYQARITREDLAPIGSDFAQAIAALIPKGTDAVLLDAAMTGIPGLTLTQPTLVSGEQKLATIVADNLEALRQPQDNLSFQKAVPTKPQHKDATTPAADSDTSAQAATPATHILVNDRAQPLTAENTLIGAITFQAHAGVVTVKDPAGADVSVNGRPAQPGQALQLGDVVRAGDTEARLIHVEG